MTNLALAALFLLASHLGSSSTPLRPWLVARLGERPYQAAYTLVSFGAFAWLIVAYWQAPYIEVWLLGVWAAWLPLIVMPFALLLVVCGVSTPNPTAVGSPDTLDRAQPVRGIVRVTRHPFMWGAALWALSHMAPNGDAASLVLFGGLAVLALLGTLLIDHKFALRRGAKWRQFAAASSNLPLGAILAGRQTLVPAEIGWRRVGVAVALYLLLLAMHPWLFGVSPFGAI